MFQTECEGCGVWLSLSPNGVKRIDWPRPSA
jgi:hypothetical protein